MECSICYDAINSQTGNATLSCSHSYHISCLTHWFAKNPESQTCPFCRHQVNDTEKAYCYSDEEEEDDDDDYDEDEDEEEEVGEHDNAIISMTRAQINDVIRIHDGISWMTKSEFACMNYVESHTTGVEFHIMNEILELHNARQMNSDEWGQLVIGEYIESHDRIREKTARAVEKFRYIKSRTTEDGFKAYAASRITALFRGIRTRVHYKKLLRLKADREYHATMMKNQKELFKKTTNRAKFYYTRLSMTQQELRAYATDMIKRAIQRHYLRKIHLMRASKNQLKALLFTSLQNLVALERIINHPKKVLMLRCKSMGCQVSINTDEIKAHIRTIVKTQALWRSYKVHRVYRAAKDLLTIRV